MLTENEVYNSLLEWEARREKRSRILALDKEQAKAALQERIKQEPAWAAALPIELLKKLKIKHDFKFSQADKALAKAIGGKLTVRLTGGKNG